MNSGALSKKPRMDRFECKLSKTQIASILQWLSVSGYRDVKKRVQEEFHVSVSLGALHRFWSQYGDTGSEPSDLGTIPLLRKLQGQLAEITTTVNQLKNLADPVQHDSSQEELKDVSRER